MPRKGYEYTIGLCLVENPKAGGQGLWGDAYEIGTCPRKSKTHARRSIPAPLPPDHQSYDPI